MWVSPEGVLNTNAWGSAQAALPARTVSTLHALSSSERREFADAVHRRQFGVMEEILDSLAVEPHPAREQVFENQWAPPEALSPLDADTADGILAGLDRIDLRWRLDAIQVLGACLDDPTEA
ncbi:MAG: hypothetical protein M3116_08420 [Actinomycetota bacterium]|nr:hypothetical protein [Actinomycetota bacterium]